MEEAYRDDEEKAMEENHKVIEYYNVNETNGVYVAKNPESPLNVFFVD